MPSPYDSKEAPVSTFPGQSFSIVMLLPHQSPHEVFLLQDVATMAGMALVLNTSYGAVLRYPDTFKFELVATPYDKKCQQTDNSKSKKKHKKKCEPRQLNEGEIAQLDYFAKIREDLLQRYDNLLTASRMIGYFPVQPSAMQPCSTKTGLLCDMDNHVCKAEDCVLDLCSDCTVEGELVGKFIQNKSEVSIKLKALKSIYDIPGLSSFLLSDICELDLLVSHLVSTRYNLVVIDPPWENRSAIRGKKYQWISHSQLTSLPIPLLSAPGALIVVWVTNKRKLSQFVQDTLFPCWNVTTVGEWHWIKVTTEGELVFNIDSTHKKPYEVLIIGEYRGVDLSSRSSENDEFPPGAKKGKITSYPQTSVPLPYHNAFMCVPTTVHSQKPYLGDLLAPYLPKDPCCLELFARNLNHGWTSWGNEVLKFQEISS